MPWTTTLPAFAAEPVSGPLRAFVREFRYDGATVFTSAELHDAVALVVTLPGTLDDRDLQAACLAVTAHYRDHGYVNSVVELPDQSVTNDVITLSVVEGRLSATHAHGMRRLTSGWIERRIQTRVRRPLETNQLAEALQTLRRDANLTQLRAELQPEMRDGRVVLGGAVLDVQVVEGDPWQLSIHGDNYRPPSVGAEQLRLEGGHLNLTGHGDVLQVSYGVLQRERSGGMQFSGLDNVGVAYSLPITLRGTVLSASYDRRDYAVIEEPFQDLDIESRYWSAGIRLDQPLLRQSGRELTVGLGLERRHSEGRLLGEPFSFTAGSIEGETDVSVLRLIANWNQAWTNQSLAFRLVTSIGVDALEATVGRAEPDGRFIALLGQGQYARRLWDAGGYGPGGAARLVARAGLQWAPDGLLAMEQLSIGGVSTVRGYRENLLVRDTGLLASLELPIRILERSRLTMTAGPFLDFGAGWNVDVPTPDPVSLLSVGVGFEASLWERFRIRLDWGHPFNSTGPDTGDAQDLGLHFSLSARIW